jgi:hypothetical protein
MEYFSNYKKSKHYYSIYNRYVKCREYQKYNDKGWTLDGDYHNLKGPAYKFYIKNVLIYEVYYTYGIRNTIGPSVIHYTKSGKHIEYYDKSGVRYRNDICV